MSSGGMPDEQSLRSIFQMVDRDRSNAINSIELQSALSNGTWNPFNIEIVRLMMSMFDRDRSGTVNFEEFKQLWNYITGWLNCFKSFDVDNSGSINKQELNRALTTFGYRFTDQFYESLIRMFDQKVNFDDFLQICIYLQLLTNEFRKYDTDLDGVINITYEQFVSLVFNIVIRK